MAQEKEYYAFISYQRKDEEWAERLRNKLEHYRMPSSVRKQDASLPKEIRPIFRDALELAGGVLAKEIETALQQSKYLIVICSPNSAKSPWVNKEIQTFIDLGREDRIIPFIIDCTPFSENPDTECFPPALRSLKDEKELLGININDLGRDAASIKVVARMFGLKFDTLWQRYEREQRKQRRRRIGSIIGGVSVLAIASIIFALIVSAKNTQLEKANDELLISQSQYMAKVANEMIKTGQYLEARRLAADALPISLSHPNRPYIVEAEEAFRNSFNIGNLSSQYGFMAFLKGHNDCILHVDINNKNDRILSISQDNTLRIWDLPKSEQLFISKAEIPNEAFFLTKNNDGKIIFVYPNKITLWDVEKCKLLKDFSISNISEPIINDTRQYLIFYNSHAKKLQIFDISLWDVIKDIPIPNEYINQLSVDKNMTYLVIGSGKSFSQVKDNNNRITIWDINKNRELISKSGFSGCIHRVSISCDGKQVAFTHFYDNNIYVANTINLNITDTLKGHSETIRSLKFSPISPSELLSGSYDNSIKVWNIQSRDYSTIPNPSTDEDWPSCLTFSINGNLLVGGLWEKLYVWGNSQTNDAHYYNNVQKFFYSKDGELLCYIEKENNKFHCIDTKTFEEIPSYNGFSQQNWQYDDLIDETTRSKITDLLSKELGNSSVTNILFSNSRKHAYVTYENEEYDLFVAKVLINDSVIQILKTKNIGINISYINDIRLSSDESLLLLSLGVLSSEGNASIVIDSNSLDIVSQYSGFNSGVLMSCFIPNTSKVVSCSYDMSIKVWDFQSADFIKQLYSHRDFVMHVSSCRSGKYFVSSGQDGLITIWETNSWKPIESLHFSKYEHPVLFSPNGKSIAILDGDILLIKEIKSIYELEGRDKI